LTCEVHASFCVEALQEPIAKHGASEIMNTDQGNQLDTSKYLPKSAEF